MATKVPAWARTPRYKKTVDLANNGHKSGKELLVSVPRLGLRLAKLLGVDSATLDVEEKEIAIVHAGKEVTIGTGELADFIIDREDYLPSILGITIVSDPDNTSLLVGGELQLSLEVSFSDETTETLTDNLPWVSTDPEVASVTEDGEVVALAEGEVGIQVTAYGFTETLELTVSAPE